MKIKESLTLDYKFNYLHSKQYQITCFKSSLISSLLKQPPRVVLLVKGIIKMSSKFTGEHPCQSVISIKLESNFI